MHVLFARFSDVGSDIVGDHLLRLRKALSIRLGSDQEASFFIIAGDRYSENVPSVSMEELERAFSSNTAPALWPSLIKEFSPTGRFSKDRACVARKKFLTPLFGRVLA